MLLLLARLIAIIFKPPNRAKGSLIRFILSSVFSSCSQGVLLICLKRFLTDLDLSDLRVEKRAVKRCIFGASRLAPVQLIRTTVIIIGC